MSHQPSRLSPREYRGPRTLDGFLGFVDDVLADARRLSITNMLEADLDPDALAEWLADADQQGGETRAAVEKFLRDEIA